MRRSLLVCVLTLLLAALATAPAAAKPKAVKAGQLLTVACPAGQLALGGVVTWLDKRSAPLGTEAGRPDGNVVVFGPAPKDTAVAVVDLDCLGITFLEGTAPVTDQGVILYGIPGLPIPGGSPPTVQACPAGSELDFARSTFTHPPTVTVELFDLGDPFVIATYSDPFGSATVSYRLACVTTT